LREFELQSSRRIAPRGHLEPSREPLHTLRPIAVHRTELHEALAAETPKERLSVIPDVAEESLGNDVLAMLSHYTGGGKRMIVHLLTTKSPVRAVAIFALLAVIFTAPFQAVYGFANTVGAKEDVQDIGRIAMDNLMRGASALSSQKFDVATTNFEKASNKFDEAEQSLQNINGLVSIVASIVPATSRTLESGRALISVGSSLSRSAALLADAAAELSTQDASALVTKIGILKNYISTIVPLLTDAQKQLARVDTSVIPEAYASQFTQLTSTLPGICASFEEFVAYADTLNQILGEEQKMRYLLVFQNNTEIRATGGFMGSFAQVDLLNGALTAITVPEGGTYDIQGQLSEFVSAPQPLQLLDPRWEFQDANWFPDFPTSAQKILWFYEHAGGPTVDGVIAINASILPKILEITGPIEMPAYGKTIDSENVIFETQKIVEDDYVNVAIHDETRTVEAPKQFIGDLSQVLLEHMKQASMDELLAMTTVLANALTEQEAQLYFSNNELQSRMLELGWAGAQTHVNGDYLQIVDTNLGGGKTDAVISEETNLHVDIADDGSVTNTVTFTKTHHGLKSALFEGLNNVDYVRLYVPKGSELLSASGFTIPDASLFEASEIALSQDEDLKSIVQNSRKDKATGTDIWEENGYTVFGNWMQTPPGETQTITFSYQTPLHLAVPTTSTFFDLAKEKLGFKEYASYSLFIQKQSGILSRITSVTVSAPNTLTSTWESSTKTGDRYQFDNTTNAHLSILFSQ
jgi:hypothetical protein